MKSKFSKTETKNIIEEFFSDIKIKPPRTLFLHGMGPIGSQIHNDLMNLGGVCLNGKNGLWHVCFNFNGCGNRRPLEEALPLHSVLLLEITFVLNGSFAPARVKALIANSSSTPASS